MKKIGITGAAGVIGSTLVKGLSDKYELVLYDIKSVSCPQNCKAVKVDLADRSKIKGIFDGLDGLIHLAGNPRPDAPAESTYRINFMGTAFCFDEAMKAGVKKIVFASSNFYHQAAIGDALREQSWRSITLDMPPTPECLYGESKVFGENVGRYLAYLGAQFVALRIGWTVPQDNPAMYGGDYMRAVFCSKRDLVQAFDKALEIKTDFMAAFAVSKNTRGVFDLRETEKQLGFHPQDNAEEYF